MKKDESEGDSGVAGRLGKPDVAGYAALAGVPEIGSITSQT
jgi:hypothetical protein